MDDLALLAEMRRDVPADATYGTALQALTAELEGARRPAPRRSRRRPVLLSALVAGAVAAGAVVTILDLNSGNDRHAPPPVVVGPLPQARLVAVTSPLTLAGNAEVVARSFPIPGPHEWVYVKEQTTTSHAPPSGAQVQDKGTHRVTEHWTRVDFQAVAAYQHGRLVVTDNGAMGGLGTPYGWPAITYSYLTSLPTDPDSLLRQIRHNLSTEPKPDLGVRGDADVFTSIVALVENYTSLPPRLNAALYGVLARLKTVGFAWTRDNAGRKVLSLYQVDQGQKHEILIDPATYAYAGQRITVVSGHTTHADDGPLHLRKGQLLDDEAILVSKIVKTPGARS